MSVRWCAIGAFLLLTACGVPHTRPGSPPAQGAAPVPAAGAPAPNKGAMYRIDSAQSELRLLVYRAGAMASFGHNHVIVNRALGGWVQYGGTAAGAAFALQIPVSGFVVDDARARAQEGEEFAADVPEEAKAGTLRNMLSPAVLDAAQFPEIAVRSLAVEGAGDALRASVSIEVAGHSSTLLVPFSLESSPGRLRGSGAVTLRQSLLGLEPYSVLLGALRVQDDLYVKFTMVASAD